MTDPDRDPGQVRPYAITGGRTRPSSLDLPVEALVRLTRRGQAALPLLVMEWRQIGLLCQPLAAVAEISAHLRIPLGVARILVADMAAEGLVTVIEHDADDLDGADPDLLGRVLDGLRSI